MLRFCGMLILVVMSSVTAYRAGQRTKNDEYENELKRQATVIHQCSVEIWHLKTGGQYRTAAPMTPNP